MLNGITLESIQSLVWSPPLLLFLCFVSVYFTIALRGLQFRYLGYSLKTALKRDKSDSATTGDITNFQALMTSLAAAIGTGNIAGVATALATGGMGALFWMWVIALLGMILKYSEALLAVKFRIKNPKGEMSGGPMYYLARGLGWKGMALCFAIFGVFATLGTGNMVQVNSVADAIGYLFTVPRIHTGIALAIITGIVLLGGVKSIGRVAEVFVPAMAGLYLAGGLLIIFMNLDKVPSTLAYILQCAFSGEAARGGFLGASISLTIQSGIARGIFSNEAGLGTSSIASAAAKTEEVGTQGMISMTSAFISTIIVCSVTGLVIGVTGVMGSLDPSTGLLLNGAPMAMKAFDSQIQGGGYVVSFGLIFFAYSTILGWAYYGEKCVEYIGGTRLILPYRLVYILCMIPAATLDLQSVWTIADITNGLMMIPNLLGLLALRKVIISETKQFCEKIKQEQQGHPSAFSSSYQDSNAVSP